MRGKRLIALIMTGILLTGCSMGETLDKGASPLKASIVAPFDADWFYGTLGLVEDSGEGSGWEGMVLPHHLLASTLIHDGFQSLDSASVERVLLVGPDHRSLDGLRIFTTDCAWRTPFGTVSPDPETVELFLASGLVESGGDVISQEHSIGNLMPFFAFHLPDVPVTALAVPGTLSLEESVALGHLLHEATSSRETLVVASLDFAHDLLSEVAQVHDQETWAAALAGDHHRLMMMDDGYLDSSQTLVAFLVCMEDRGTESMELIHRSDASEILRVGNQPVTSYMTWGLR